MADSAVLFSWAQKLTLERLEYLMALTFFFTGIAGNISYHIRKHNVCVLWGGFILQPLLLLFFEICIYLFLTAQGLSHGTRELPSLLWHAGYIQLQCVRSFQMWHANSQFQHVGSSSLTLDQTQTPCIGRGESQPLDHLQPSL